MIALMPRKSPRIKTPVYEVRAPRFDERRAAHLIRDPLRVVFSTATPAEAEKLARTLVEERLAACASLVANIHSQYWWKGKIESAAETLMILKTPASRINALRRRLKALHSYTVPEFLALQVLENNPDYANWAAKETGGA